MLKCARIKAVFQENYDTSKRLPRDTQRSPLNLSCKSYFSVEFSHNYLRRPHVRTLDAKIGAKE